VNIDRDQCDTSISELKNFKKKQRKVCEVYFSGSSLISCQNVIMYNKIHDDSYQLVCGPPARRLHYALQLSVLASSRGRVCDFNPQENYRISACWQC